MVDFHTHILPNMDDGSDSVDTSLKMLNILENDGVKLVCLTSHFYAFNESIDDFLKRREESFNKINYNGNLKIKLGAEVHYYRGISESEDLCKLCLENTKILLIELPFMGEITPNIIDEIIKLKVKGYTVVLAHIERYGLKTNIIENLHNNGILIQVNAEFFEGFFNKNKAIKMLKMGLIDFIGTDCHNLTTRKPNYSIAKDLLYNKLGIDFYDEFNKKTMLLADR